VMYLGDKVGVIGVYSLSDSKPLKIANFDARFLNMENRQKISDWKFMTAQQAALPLRPAAPPAVGAGLSAIPATPAAGVAVPGGVPAQGAVSQEVTPPSTPVPDTRVQEKPEEKPAEAEPEADEKDKVDEKDKGDEKEEPTAQDPSKRR
jgi:hypothetical protein